MNKEIIDTIRKAKSVDEFKEVANDNGYPLTDKEAKNYFDLFHTNGKVVDNELDNVVGGSICKGGRQYSTELAYYGALIVTDLNSCDGFRHDIHTENMSKTCDHCWYSFSGGGSIIGEASLYCEKRTLNDDPYNSKIGTHRTKRDDGTYWDIK